MAKDKSADFFRDSDYGAMMRGHIAALVGLLIYKDVSFRIVVRQKFVKFEPELPEDIASQLGSGGLIVFGLSNYTLESAKVRRDELIFEAGFGPDNFASVVCLPMGSIVQIDKDDSPLLINLSHYEPQKLKERIDKLQERMRSMQIFLKNPKNRDIFRD